MSFFEILRKCSSFHWNVNYVSDGSYYYFKTIFQHACRNGIQITWFWRWTQNKLFNFIFWPTFKNVHFRSNFWFLRVSPFSSISYIKILATTFLSIKLFMSKLFFLYSVISCLPACLSTNKSSTVWLKPRVINVNIQVIWPVWPTMTYCWHLHNKGERKVVSKFDPAFISIYPHCLALKLPAWKVGECGSAPRSGIQV